MFCHPDSSNIFTASREGNTLACKTPPIRASVAVYLLEILQLSDSLCSALPILFLIFFTWDFVSQSLANHYCTISYLWGSDIAAPLLGHHFCIATGDKYPLPFCSRHAHKRFVKAPLLFPPLSYLKQKTGDRVVLSWISHPKITTPIPSKYCGAKTQVVMDANRSDCAFMHISLTLGGKSTRNWLQGSPLPFFECSHEFRHLEMQSWSTNICKHCTFSGSSLLHIQVAT